MRKARAVVNERSAGAVVYHVDGAAREYLLLRYGAGHWGFPKGHVEPGETDEQTAVREVEEETSIPVDAQRFAPGFDELTTYAFHRGRTRVDKQVRFYLVQSSTRTVRISHEHTAFGWFPFGVARDHLTFDGPRNVLEKAEAYLNAASAE